MHERRGVDQLERLGEVEHDLAVGMRAEARGQEHQRRPQELPRGREEVRDRGLEGRMRAASDLAETTLELTQLGIDRCVERGPLGHPHGGESRLRPRASSSAWAYASEPAVASSALDPAVVGWAMHRDCRTERRTANPTVSPAR